MSITGMILSPRGDHTVPHDSAPNVLILGTSQLDDFLGRSSGPYPNNSLTSFGLMKSVAEETSTYSKARPEGVLVIFLL